MQVNRINPTSFGTGFLVVNPRAKGCSRGEYNPQCLSPENIKDIKKDGEYVNIKYEKTDSKVCDVTLSKTVPIESFLAAYTAAMVAPDGTFIDISEVPKSY